MGRDEPQPHADGTANAAIPTANGEPERAAGILPDSTGTGGTEAPARPATPRKIPSKRRKGSREEFLGRPLARYRRRTSPNKAFYGAAKCKNKRCRKRFQKRTWFHLFCCASCCTAHWKDEHAKGAGAREALKAFRQKLAKYNRAQLIAFILSRENV